MAVSFRPRYLALGGGAALAVAGITASLLVSPGTTPAARADALTPFDNCAEVEEWYRSAALSKVTAYGLPEYGGGMMVAQLDTATAAAEESAADTRDLGAVGNGETGTNVQEAGVDEPDIAKTDGDLAAVIDGRSLVTYDVSGEHPRELGRLRIPYRGTHELLLVGDRAVVLSELGYAMYPRDPMVDAITMPVAQRTGITTVDLADPASPAVVDRRTVDGSNLSAREHDGTVRIAISSTPRLDWVYGTTHESRLKTIGSEWRALGENRRRVREATAQDWLPTMRTPGGKREPLVDCADVRHPDEKAGLGTITLITLDPATPDEPETTAVTADGSLVYSSADRFYVASTEGGWWNDSRSDSTTDIHAFDVSTDDTEYVASGSVDGHVPDRWALSEHEGNLRVASMQGDLWAPDETRVSVLAEDGGKLRVVGEVGGLGKDESIQAVRWFGDLAVVVTFREIDPLYTVDLSDPGSPEVLGELKIPGFSNYLHPIGDDLLIGIGQDASMQGRTRGAQASTFDLSDLTRPDRIATLGLGDQTESSVQYDARTFTYLPQERVMFVPVTDWRRGDRTVAVVDVAEDGSLDLRSSLAVEGDGVRVLPLEDGRVALVERGEVSRLLQP